MPAIEPDAKTLKKRLELCLEALRLRKKISPTTTRIEGIKAELKIFANDLGRGFREVDTKLGTFRSRRKSRNGSTETSLPSTFANGNHCPAPNVRSTLRAVLSSLNPSGPSRTTGASISSFIEDARRHHGRPTAGTARIYRRHA